MYSTVSHHKGYVTYHAGRAASVTCAEDTWNVLLICTTSSFLTSDQDLTVQCTSLSADVGVMCMTVLCSNLDIKVHVKGADQGRAVLPTKRTRVRTMGLFASRMSPTSREQQVGEL